MKSINFTMLKDKLLDGSKRQTIRTIFIPKYVEGEIVQIKFCKEPLFKAIIEYIQPFQLKNLDCYIAINDGFNNLDDMRRGLMTLNKGLKLEHWVFLIKFKRVD